MVKADDLKKELKKLEDKRLKEVLQRFFKMGKGGYAENDLFLGIKVGTLRAIAEKYEKLGIKEVKKLLRSKIHEHRFTALLILVNKYEEADEKGREDIFKAYMENIEKLNNWDLVDFSAPKIVGNHLTNKDKEVLYDLAKSKNVWDRRIAILSTFTFIKRNDFKDAIAISEKLLKDENDLIHKAVGWMLREIGKRSLKVEEEFLKKHYKRMPRTMLRYAIEKLNDEKKKFYMKK